jgi:hypothetical protein
MGKWPMPRILVNFAPGMAAAVAAVSCGVQA